jgi:hypothetical protein
MTDMLPSVNDLDLQKKQESGEKWENEKCTKGSLTPIVFYWRSLKWKGVNEVEFSERNHDY